MQCNLKRNSAETGSRPVTDKTERQDDNVAITRNPIDTIAPVGVIPLFILFAVSVSIGLVVLIERYEQDQYRDSLLRTAGESSQSITNFRLFYSREIVSRLKGSDITITHDYKQHDHAIPLPATMSIEFGKFLEETGSGSAFRLYSGKPFPWRADRRLDDFEVKALQYLQANPGKTYHRIETLDDKEYLRFATPVIMQESCVSLPSRRQGICPSPFRSLSPRSAWLEKSSVFLKGCLLSRPPLSVSQPVLLGIL